jgi:hypothetical protein
LNPPRLSETLMWADEGSEMKDLDIGRLRRDLASATAGRDSFKGRSAELFEMTSQLVRRLEIELQQALELAQPKDESIARGCDS